MTSRGRGDDIPLPTPGSVVAHVAYAFNLRPQQLSVQHGREAQPATARAVVAYLLRTQSHLRYAAIATTLGYADHTTAYRHIVAVSERIKHDSTFRTVVTALASDIQAIASVRPRLIPDTENIASTISYRRRIRGHAVAL